MNDLHFGVCVGIDRYPGFPGRDLGSARGDAESFAGWLLAPDGGGLPPDNVAVVTASPEEIWRQAGDARPQYREVYRGLHGFNKRLRSYLDAQPADRSRSRLYIYAAGHGIGPPDGECALLMADAEEGLIGDNLELSVYRDWYLACGDFAELVIFADCCRELAPGAPPANRPPFDLCTNPQTRTTAFTGYATRMGDPAWEPGDMGERDRARGYFTRAVLGGLRGGPVDPALGVVTSTTLAQYVEQAVAQMTRGLFPPQRAETIAPENPILFGMTAAPASHQARIRFPKAFSGGVALQTGRSEEVARWRAADGPWTIDLPDGYYALVPVDSPDPGDWLFKVVGDDVDVQL
jgi:hypothetical protein